MSFDSFTFAQASFSRAQELAANGDHVGAVELLTRSEVIDRPRFSGDEDAIRMSLFDMPELDTDALPRKRRRTK